MKNVQVIERNTHTTSDVLLARRFVCFIHTRTETQCTRQSLVQIDEKYRNNLCSLVRLDSFLAFVHRIILCLTRVRLEVSIIFYYYDVDDKDDHTQFYLIIIISNTSSERD